jgi:endonuclease/exonuclease/phosphatase family metal-dependent hydrolase
MMQGVDSSDELCVAFANVAGGRLVDQDRRYVDADRTPDFGAVIAGLRPDVLIVTELDCDGDQLEQLATAAMSGRELHLLRHDWSDSHIPGVRRLGVGIASTYPLQEIDRINLPDPPFDLLHVLDRELLAIPLGDVGPISVRFSGEDEPQTHVNKQGAS